MTQFKKDDKVMHIDGIQITEGTIESITQTECVLNTGIKIPISHSRKSLLPYDSYVVYQIRNKASKISSLKIEIRDIWKEVRRKQQVH